MSSKRSVDVADLARRMAVKFPPPAPPEPPPVPAPKRRGRPPGVKNRVVPADPVRLANIEHTDPLTLCERQFVVAEWMQSAFRDELRRRMGTSSVAISMDDVKRFEGISIALDRAVKTARAALDTAEELAGRMTAEQLLEAALKKIQAQETSYVRYAMKVLRAHLDRVAPRADRNRAPLGTAVEAMASLEDD
jgi:hypothetical protein